MSEDTIAKIYTLLPWLIVLIAMIGLTAPIANAVSLTSTASYQALQVAKTGGSELAVEQQAANSLGAGLPLQLDGTTLFDPTQDVTINTSNPPYVSVTVVYHLALMWPVTQFIGWAGPTINIKQTHEDVESSEDNHGIPSQ
ncbi:hypothetical protein [Alicyclobacillus fodiniaquatilis]|uniref:Transmembrane protein n=1 Tax=Alicyclobacillus fodiniaquatilis TaxID=1661150 RepID=A0ABW4JJW2_9BACL